MSQEMPQGKDLNLTFDVLENNGAFLRCRYQAENVSASDLYIFNRLWHEYNENYIFELDDNLVYISAQDNTARLLKGIPDIPYGMTVAMPIVPCVTLLPRDQSMNETFQIELPLRQLDPYIPEERPVIANPNAIIFSLGYFPVSEIGEREVNYVRSTMGQILFAYVNPWDQLVVSTAPVPITVSGVVPPEQRKCPKCGAEQLPDSKFCGQCGSPL